MKDLSDELRGTCARSVTLGFIASDYLSHLRHHLHQIGQRD
jgi:hypothetical protein